MSHTPCSLLGFFQLMTKVWMPLSSWYFTTDFSGERSLMYILLICGGMVSCGIS